jgi:hypothetical protein
MRRISARSIEWIAFAASSAVILYVAFAAFDYVLLGTGQDNCVNARKAPVADERGVRAEAMARFCDLIGWPNEKRLGLHLSDDSGDSVLVFYEPRNDRDTPVLRWLDDDHVSVDLGNVTGITPQIRHLGRVTISYTYSGAEPRLE